MRAALLGAVHAALARLGVGPEVIRRRLRRQIGSGLVSIGAYTYGTPDVRHWGEDAQVEIGAYCSIAAGVVIFAGGNHRVDWVSTFPFSAFPEQWPAARGVEGHPATRGSVRIGNDVWLGDGAVILSGVTIGDGAVVAARAVVSRDVDPYMIVAGNPARPIRNRFDAETVSRLQSLRWWSWPPEEVNRRVGFLMAPPGADQPRRTTG